MEQPPGYVTQGENKVCYHRKTIYELNQSPRAWFEKFNITSLTLIFIVVTQITLSLFGILSMA